MARFGFVWFRQVLPKVPVALVVLMSIPARGAADLDRYNVVWTTPSRSAAGAMPIGNGEVGLNVWVEEDGDLRFYISRTDAWSESCRLLKVGRIRVALSPNPFAKGAPFRQELSLREGTIHIAAGEGAGRVSLKLFVDAKAPVIHMLGESAQLIDVTASAEIWRTEKKTLKGAELQSSWTMQDAPEGVDVWETADVVRDTPKAVTWFHHNGYSIVPLTIKHQGLETVANAARDPLLNRTFGAQLSAPGFVKASTTSLRTAAPVRNFAVTIVTHTAQTETAEAWEQAIGPVATSAASPAKAAKQTSDWWRAFWERSWIFVENDGALTALPQSRHPLRIGMDASGGNRFQGSFGRASLFQRPLTGGEIEALAATKPDTAEAPVRGALASWMLTTPSGVPSNMVGGGWELTRNKAAFELPPNSQHALSNAFTFEAWIRPDAAAAGRLLDSMTPGGSDGVLLDTHPGSNLRLIVGADTLNAEGVLATGRWQHVAAVADAASGARRIYLDGKLVQGAGGGSEGSTAPPSRVTQGYILQRWMTACAGRGNYPIKFNGSIFTVDPQFTDPKVTLNPDWRRWGDCYWWQNSRFPGYAAIAAGDYELCEPLFRLYREVLPLCKARAKLYHDVDGAYFPETMTIFGAYSNNDYGWKRKGHKPNEVLNNYWRFAWQQGLELVMLMLEYYEHTDDREFLREQLVPMSDEVLRYFDTRFKRDAQGRLVISPTQAVETYWRGVTNDTPTVAGLHAVLDRLLALQGVPEAKHASWQRIRSALPEVPVRVENGVRFIPPAEYFDPQRNNCENPELYAVWPFRLYGVHRPDLAAGIETFKRRQTQIMTGWCYDGQCAAILGLAAHARQEIETKVRNSHPNHRFPAMWGPNFDWLPDQDHGGNILLTLQNMLMVTDAEKIFLLPAWPKEWNVKFKLHAPHRTVVEGEYRNGKLVRYDVTPNSRRHDVTVVGETRGAP